MAEQHLAAFREITRYSPNKKRTVYAPQPDHLSLRPTVISVELDEDEEVEWEWTHFADGRSCVTGYTIVKTTGQIRNKGKRVA